MNNIIQDLVYPNMYRVVYPDGVLSDNFYNKTRAKEHLFKIQAEMGSSIHSTMPLRSPRKAAGAFK